MSPEAAEKHIFGVGDLVMLILPKGGHEKGTIVTITAVREDQFHEVLLSVQPDEGETVHGVHDHGVELVTAHDRDQALLERMPPDQQERLKVLRLLDVDATTGKSKSTCKTMAEELVLREAAPGMTEKKASTLPRARLIAMLKEARANPVRVQDEIDDDEEPEDVDEDDGSPAKAGDKKPCQKQWTLNDWALLAHIMVSII